MTRRSYLIKFLTLAVGALLLSTNLVSAAWWNDNWKFRRPISISGTHPENHHLRVVVPYDPDMQPDYSDLRFLENENSGALAFWIESATPSRAVVWVKRKENLDNLIYLYYGNSSASRGDNWENTILPYVDHKVVSAAPWSGRMDFASAVYDNKIWILGGFNGAEDLNDVWASSDGVSWVLVTESAGWSPRRGHAALVFDNKLWVLGGSDSSVWYTTDGENWVLATSSPGWSARWGFGAVVHDNKMWVLGGYDGNYLNDVWYSENGVDWIRVTSAAPWPPRHSHSVLSYNGKLWLLGGYTSGDYLNDVWVWENWENADNWSRVVAGANWIPRRDHVSLVFDNRMWIMGGNGENWYEYLNDLWYSTDGAKWFSASPAGNWSARYKHGAVVFNNKIWLFGGYDGSPRNDVWCLLRSYTSPEPEARVLDEHAYPPAIPIWPLDGRGLNDNSPVFRWENHMTADNWEFWLDNSPTFDNSGGLLLVENVRDNWIDIGSLGIELEDENYFWRVRAWTDSFVSDFSPTSSVMIDTVPPTAFDLISVFPDRGATDPEDNVTTNATDILFEWALTTDSSKSATGESSGIKCYEVIIDDDGAPPYVRSENTADNTSSALVQNLPEGNWRWWVRAWDWAGNYTDSTAQWTLNIDLTAYPPDPLSPENGTYTNATKITFDWTDGYDPAGVGKYRLRVDDDPDFSSPVLDIMTSVSRYIHIFDLPADGLYYWQVKLKDNAGDDSGPGEGNWSDWSGTFRFLIDTLPPLAPESLITLENGAVLRDRTPYFSWRAATDNTEITSEVAGVEKYVLQIDRNSDFSSPIQFTVTGENWFSLPDSHALADGTWYWRVRSVDAAGNQSSWSPTGTFTISVQQPSAKISTSIQISPSTFSMRSGAVLSLTATLLDSAGNPLPDKPLEWSASAGDLSDTLTSTDNAGRASVEYIAPVVDNEITVVLSVSFGGDAAYGASTASATGVVSPQKALDVSLSVVAESAVVLAGENLELIAVLADPNGWVSNAPISWDASIGHLSPRHTITDGNGRAKTTYTAPFLKSDSEAIITAVFAGDPEHAPGRADVRVLVLSEENSNLLLNIRENLKAFAESFGLPGGLSLVENSFVSGLLGAVIVFHPNAKMRTVYLEAIKVEITEVNPQKRIVLKSEVLASGRIVVFNIPYEILPAEKELEVMVDDTPAIEVESYSDITSLDEPRYFVLRGGAGLQLFVSLPVPSTYLIAIRTQPEPSWGPWYLAVLILTVAVLLLSGILLKIRPR